MGHAYRAVGWNRQKKRYDRVLVLGIATYIALFVGVGFAIHPDATAETMLIRALGTGAFLLLHVVLCIGPLARFDPRFLPLLYNRRHLGVATFALGFAHGAFSLVQFHAFGDRNPLVSLFLANTRFDSLSQFPFHPLGAAALVILFLMAATSHDFWLKNLTPPVWKALHMLVYVAYALLVAHVALGALQAERDPVLLALLTLGVAAVTGSHLAAGVITVRADDSRPPAADDGWVRVGPAGSIREGRARIVMIAEERVAVFRYDGKVSAISNVCRHQNGPLGEGRVIDGCVTCPWHGYQYRPHDGASPPPFEEKVPTFRVRVEEDVVWVHEAPLPPGTPVEPARWTPPEDRA